MPRQQIVDRVVGDAGEQVAQVGLRIEAVEGRGLDKRVEDRSPTTTGVGAGEEVIFPARSTTLVSISMRPSSRKRVNAGKRLSR